MRLREIGHETYKKWLRDRPSAIAVDTETTGTEWSDGAFCMTIAWNGDSGYLELPIHSSLSEVILLNTDIWIFHNAKFDLHKLIQAGIIQRNDVVPERFEDTEILAHLFNEHQFLGLKKLARSLLKVDTPEEEAVKAACKKYKTKNYAEIPRGILIPYAIRDAELTLDLWDWLYPRTIDWARDNYYIEKHLSLVLLDAENAGLGVDRIYTDDKIIDLRRSVLSGEVSLRKDSGKDDFNPNSPLQVSEVLSSFGISVPDTRKETLAKIDHDFVKKLQIYRNEAKLLNTYLLNVQKESLDSDTCGRDLHILHPWFRQARTKTGRMASGKMTHE